jgi:hypothetical protein
MRGIADTGFIVAFARENDKYHGWALYLAARVNEPLLTCEAVLAEATFHLSSSFYVLSLLEDGLLQLAVPATSGNFGSWRDAILIANRIWLISVSCE